ncbi:hypothetical protein ANOM_000391 [Aspergillus nomiae NRRL 13137]|uniref:Uncharacterized protein n=1 Tax=Aspergillus nomiae NRRL (strain ATCC 15546 / NRRL 13137 / CBS 260.88 / M93) TaxID=1509407 RepID=A0A0L1JHH7_ASPN3|nr:uncharacterized protein ANOM_000391 [Aspergillus nomiae NRRL 13137]KNG91219.1 hypothetical protein ANOM_000391 [Aspergillus nomiae NRRL 13137]
MALLMNAAELLSRLPTIPSSNSDLDEHEDHKAVLQDAPSVIADPEDEPILRNAPSVQAEPNNEDNGLFVPDAPSTQGDSDGHEDNEFIAMQEERYPVADTSPPPSPQPSPDLFGTPTVAAPAVSSSFTSHDEFTRSQIADQPRLSWNWRNQGKDRTIYTPTIVGKWWYRTSFELERLPKDKRRSFGHIGRIMETELGKQRFGDARCERCRTNAQECWVYSKEGAAQVCRPGEACTRCRLIPQVGGCSLSTQLPSTKGSSSSLQSGGPVRSAHSFRWLLPMPYPPRSQGLDSQGNRV